MIRELSMSSTIRLTKSGSKKASPRLRGSRKNKWLLNTASMSMSNRGEKRASTKCETAPSLRYKPFYALKDQLV